MYKIFGTSQPGVTFPSDLILPYQYSHDGIFLSVSKNWGTGGCPLELGETLLSYQREDPMEAHTKW